MIAKVSIDRKISSIANDYDYNVPSHLVDEINIGSSVFVPFGHDKVFGYVLELSGEERDGLKDIIDCVSDGKLIGSTNFKLASELSKDLNCSMGNILGLMQPSFIKGQKQQYLYVEEYSKLDANLALALNGKSKILITSALEPFKKQIVNEIKKGNITKGYEYFVYGKNKKVKVYSVIDNLPQSTKARNLVINYLTDHPKATLDDIKVSTNASSSVVKALVKSKAIKEEEIIINQVINEEKKNLSRYEFSFTEQDLVSYYDNVSSKPFLLFSSNDEFELHFYIKIISDSAKENKKVVLIYPNALSVEEAYLRIKRYLRGYDIITYHSKNTNSENFDTFNKIINNTFDVLIGTPQALLLPFSDINAMILNDTDDEMYINETYPYVNYKEAAIKKAKLLSSKIILASNTPTISDYYLASIGKYDLLNNHKQHQNDCKVIDMTEEVLETNDMIISSSLDNAIKETLNKGKISLLICNNVAFATQIKCRKCGKVLKCPHCNVPLVYIKSKDVAKCNYCNYEEKMFRSCKCGSTNYISLGFGLEQVSEKLKEKYPSARIIQANSALINSKEKMEDLIQKIEENEVDIIIGTNALTKMTKYDNMDLVGLLYVDSYLNMNNYLGGEATYNLIARASIYPHMIIQTYNPKHYAILNGINNNYDDYYKMELETRKMLEYPPFKELSIVLVKGEYSQLFHFGYYFKKAIPHNKEIVVLGPIYDYQMKGVKLVIKHNDNASVVKMVNDVIKHFDNPKIMCSYHRYTRGG